MNNYSDANQKNKDIAWSKGVRVGTNDPSVYRKDAAGAWIRYSDYGKETMYGWEVDHILPKAKGGDDSPSNLQPLQAENNLSKSDNYPDWIAVRTASGSQNVACRKQMRQR